MWVAFQDVLFSQIYSMNTIPQDCEPTLLERMATPGRLISINMPDQQACQLPESNLTQLLRMTDSTGLYQYANQPGLNAFKEYSTDNNARAFVLAAMLEDMGLEPAGGRAPAATYANFLLQAFNRKTERFHQSMRTDRCWLDEGGTEETHGRVLWALGTGVGRSMQSSYRQLCANVFTQALPRVVDFESPRAWAYALLGIHEYLQVKQRDCEVLQVRGVLVTQLLELFNKSACPKQHWFESTLKHENAKLAHALIVSGNIPGHKTVLECGLRTLAWLVERQTSKGADFLPATPAEFNREKGGVDSAIIEAQATVSACIEAYRVTANPDWYERALNAFNRLLDWNAKQSEYRGEDTGSDHGTESMLAFQLALVEMHGAQRLSAAFNNASILSL